MLGALQPVGLQVGEAVKASLRRFEQVTRTTAVNAVLIRLRLKPEERFAKHLQRHLQISQETLAEMIGTTRSRVSYFMNRFRRMGFISYNGHIEVHRSLLDAVLNEKLEFCDDPDE